MMEQLAALVFSTRNAAHQAHWATKSYSQHMALGQFYDDVLEALDALVEAYQGMFGLIDFEAIGYTKPNDIIPVMEADVRWIADNRAEITKDDAALGNLLDSVVNTYQTALYKLKNLK